MKPLPKLDLNITNKCNFHCIHCCFDSGKEMDHEMTFLQIVKVLDDFAKLGGERIDVTGGEPLTRKDVFEIIKHAKGLDLKVELVTNASLLNLTKIKRLLSLKLDQIAISLDGSNYVTYSTIRPVSRSLFNSILKNIKLCTKYGLKTKINTVVFNSNLSDLANITRFCIENKVFEQGFYYFTPVGRGSRAKHEVVDPLIWLSYLREHLLPFTSRIKLSIETPVLETELVRDLKTECYLKNPWHLQILPDGKVYPCSIIAFYNHPCGDLNEKSLKEIWSGKEFWNGSYFQANVNPLISSGGGCIHFGQKMKKLIGSGKFKFICPMCKYDKVALG